jgi:RES domain-containing protein
VVYCADSRSLAALEVLVSLDEKERLTQVNWVCLPVVLPAELISKPDRVPDDWRLYPHPAATQVFGAEWVQSQRSVALRVPSVVVPGEFNYLLNPAHPQFSMVKGGKPEPFVFDPRLG